IAGKSSGICRSLARDCDCFSPPQILSVVSFRISSASPNQGLRLNEEALVALAGRHVNETRLAVQQLIELRLATLKCMNLYAARLRAPGTPLHRTYMGSKRTKDYLEYRNSRASGS